MNAAQRWHLPSFAGWDCTGKAGMTDRERLGLPLHFVETALQLEVARATSHLRRQSAPMLLTLLQDGHAELGMRIAAGNLLALDGDPRIDPLNPEMIEIAGGQVSMGLPADKVEAVLERHARLGLSRDWIEKEVPRHNLELAPYRLARYPVTNSEYRLFLLETGDEEIPTSWAFRRYPAERANHPVHTVSARAAQAYCDWLSTRSGRCMRLPSEAEWEYAAAGPQGREFPWGETFDPAKANTAECGLFDTSPVGAFIGGESPFGLCDMGGNVEEYVTDAYGAYPGGAEVRDDLVALHGSYRIARGGAFSRFADLARTRRRHGHNPRSATYAMGFRLAETPR
ncbi:MAG: SUMF1/EgtB/PvdO family nonheme iron enzyme [Sphingomonadales bacterium]|nr:SUMF1/EgtB/PvdO family nonheme iron enzyme [Sphingomonadales bacterium]MDE2170948.1 SUMF1/EgtB/PvdO family nonheme iron enzyme [Sphingomonadales bacterium]